MAKGTYQELEKVLGVEFNDKTLLQKALTHKSYIAESVSTECNERLEFLGDSVLSTVTAHFLYERYPNDDEGKLSRLKSQLVSKPSLVVWAKEINLGKYLLLGTGEVPSPGRGRDTIIADAYEAVIGAIYLDQGFDIARQFILKALSRKKRIVETDYKSRLQEIIQAKCKQPPVYKLNKETGPDHDKTFVMEVYGAKTKLGKGQGKSKKEAEQAAARDALRTIRARESIL